MPIFVANNQAFDMYSYILIPYMPHGTLLDLLMKANQKQHILSPELKQYLIGQLVVAVDFLHSTNGLAHLDIKPDNIVLTDNFKLAINDFSFVEKLNSIISHTTGTDQYMAPEVRRTMNSQSMVYIPEKADIFSLGISLFIIMFQKMPFASATPEDSFFEFLLRGDFNGFFVSH